VTESEDAGAIRRILVALDASPESLAAEVMPHVSLAAIHDVLSYYYDHKEEVDREVGENSVEASQKYLRERLGEEGYNRITGQSK